MKTLQPKSNCPLDGFKPCRELDCAWFAQVRGTDPTGKEVDGWGCAMAWMPMLLIEGAQQSRQTGAAVESFRNVVAAGNEQTAALLAGAVQAQAQERITR
jgi:hypothetical protein